MVNKNKLAQKYGGKPQASNKIVVPEVETTGRRLCNCQARLHALVRNCLGCGKIVCVQEGSGPCMVCGTLVCTEEEKEILQRNSRKSAELYKKLTGKEMPAGGIHSLAAIGHQVELARDFRDRLLIADADTERRTRVNDLESDYCNIDRNPYLTKEERAQIVQRRDELKRMREEQKRSMILNIDLENMVATHTDTDKRATDPNYDPVIRTILEKSETRRQLAEVNVPVSAQWEPKGFIPQYAQQFAHKPTEVTEVSELCYFNEEALAAETERAGYAVALPQPAGSYLANGLLKYIRWDEDLLLKGPLYVCAKTDATPQADIDAFSKNLKTGASAPSGFPTGCVVGKAYLDEVMTLTDYSDEVDKKHLPFGSGDFVLHFSHVIPLAVPVPYLPQSNFFQVEPSFRDVLAKVFV
ncbi:unnamed protein product, partial [Mesorhabditis spiculigera]